MSDYNKRRNQDPDYIKNRRARWNRWRERNKDKIKRNPEMERQTKLSSPRRFLTDAVAHLRRSSRKKEIPFDIDLDYIDEIWKQQNGRCAISGVMLTYKRKDLFGVRIYVVKESKGYVKGNILLVSDGIKRMKRDMSDEEVRGFVEEVKSVIVA
jgi:hypothetical protein